MFKTFIIVLLLACNSVFAQSLKLDYDKVGEVYERRSITLSHQYDSIPYMLSIYLWNKRLNETRLLYENVCWTRKWKYRIFDVTKWSTGNYKFIVGFGKDLSREIEFLVWN